MNQQNSGAAPAASSPLPAPYKNRSAGLLVFGILTILLGCVAGLFVLLSVGQAAMAGSTNGTASFPALLSVMSIYGLAAVVLVWLGIGSIMARRWARALLLVFSWIWLITGVLVSLFMVFFMPRMLANMSAGGTAGQPALNPAIMGGVMIGMFLIVGVFFVIVPGVWTFFYNSRHVKATCEARDPVTRWTDACPLPVLGLCVLLIVSVPSLLVMPIAGHGVMPFFGMFLTGIPGSAFCLAFAAVWIYAAWSLYKLEPRGWWLVFIAMCVCMASGLLTFARHDMMEMYRLMDYPQAQLEQIQKFGFLLGNRMAWLILLSMLPFLGYLLFIRKFLLRSS